MTADRIRRTCLGPVAGTFGQQDAKDGRCRRNQVGHTYRGVWKDEVVRPGMTRMVDGKPETTKPVTRRVFEPCGYDLTDMINAIPADGLDYQIECPECGNKSLVKTVPPTKS